MDFNEIGILDMLELSELYVSVFNGPPWYNQWTVATAMDKMKQLIYSDGFYGLICSVDSEPCGFILGFREDQHDESHFHIKEMGVVCVKQHSGIGSQLMVELERILKDSGVHKMYLVTGKITEIVSFYTKNGFEEWDNMALLGKSII